MEIKVPFALEFAGLAGALESKVVAATRAAIAAEIELMGKDGWRLAAVVSGADPAIANMVPADQRGDLHTLVFQRLKMPSELKTAELAKQAAVAALIAGKPVDQRPPDAVMPARVPYDDHPRADEIRADLARADAAVPMPPFGTAADLAAGRRPIFVINKSGCPLRYATDGAIGLDLVAADVPLAACPLNPRETVTIMTGISIDLPEGMGAFVQPRSGLAREHGVFAITGTIDRDYRGEIGVMLHNSGRTPHEVRRGDRIAQLVIVQAPRVTLTEVSALTETTRGAHGFGSTGR